VTRKSTPTTSPAGPLDGDAVADPVGPLEDDVDPADEREQRLLERERHREADDTEREQQAHPPLGDHPERPDERRGAEQQPDDVPDVPLAPAVGAGGRNRETTT